MKPLRLRPLADADLDGAVDYLARENPAAAAAFIDAVEEACTLLRNQPRIGSPRFGHVLPVEGLRAWPLTRFSYLVFYFDRPDYVDVIRILHTSRDLPKLLLDSDD